MTVPELRLDMRAYGATPPVPQWDMPLHRTASRVLLDPSETLLRRMVVLDVEPTRDGRWLATNAAIATHGVGDTPDEAVLDFEEMMFGLFRELVRSEEVLAPHLQRQLEYLRSVLVESRVVGGYE